MKIGIDISQIVYETGVSWYTRNLVQVLLSQNKEDEFVLFGGALRRFADLNRFEKTLQGNFASRFYPFSPTMLDFLWNRLHLFPVEDFVGAVDVFHSSDWVQPPARRTKLVTTIHDLVPLRFPDISHPKIVETHKRRLEWVKKEVDKIIAVSAFTKREIVEVLGVEPERITVIFEAPVLKVVSRKEGQKVREKYKIPGDYLLVVGADPRKNIPAIIQAFGKIREKTGLNLVIVGRIWESIPDESGIVAVGHVSSDDLARFHADATALVYTSLYEGFGQPVLDAMQAGCPVVTSNITSMPEVAGDAAVLVDPTNPVEIAKGIEKVLSEPKLWIKKGKERVKQFSWEKTARQTLKVYREVISE